MSLISMYFYIVVHGLHVIRSRLMFHYNCIWPSYRVCTTCRTAVWGFRAQHIRLWVQGLWGNGFRVYEIGYAARIKFAAMFILAFRSQRKYVAISTLRMRGNEVNRTCLQKYWREK